MDKSKSDDDDDDDDILDDDTKKAAEGTQQSGSIIKEAPRFYFFFDSESQLKKVRLGQQHFGAIDFLSLKPVQESEYIMIKQ